LLKDLDELTDVVTRLAVVAGTSLVMGRYLFFVDSGSNVLAAVFNDECVVFDEFSDTNDDLSDVVNKLAAVTK
jgi:hypothetical protein